MEHETNTIGFRYSAFILTHSKGHISHISTKLNYQGTLFIKKIANIGKRLTRLYLIKMQDSMKRYSNYYIFIFHYVDSIVKWFDLECIVNTIKLIFCYPSMLLVLLYALLNLIHASFAVNIYLFTYIWSLCHPYPGHLFSSISCFSVGYQKRNRLCSGVTQYWITVW